MGNFQPNQGLTWKYYKNVGGYGQLKLLTTIYVKTGGQNFMAVPSPMNPKREITIELKPGGTKTEFPKTLELDIGMNNLAPNLAYNDVKNIINGLNEIFVTASYIDAVVPVGQAINTSSQNSELEVD